MIFDVVFDVVFELAFVFAAWCPPARGAGGLYKSKHVLNFRDHLHVKRWPLPAPTAPAKVNTFLSKLEVSDFSGKWEDACSSFAAS